MLERKWIGIFYWWQPGQMEFTFWANLVFQVAFKKHCTCSHLDIPDQIHARENNLYKCHNKKLLFKTKRNKKTQHIIAYLFLFYFIFSLIWFHLLLQLESLGPENIQCGLLIIPFKFKLMVGEEERGSLYKLQNEIEEFGSSGVRSALNICMF